MSNTIDQRVVEMRFDNSQFEKNVSTTMSTLDKLKQKLNLSGASKSLENINTAAKSVNMGGLGNAVETVTAKFSALQVMGVTALANITNSAVNAGKNIIKSLTIDPIKTGFDEYETKMGSIQTILANTEHQGTTLNDVTAALDRLNTYADKTIYNFQQMTRNIGTFTAAGVDLETSVNSIQGIANLAAVSGSTSQQASTAMYQLSQALATGKVKLMDWNSVVNAGMGGKVFQNALIRTAAMLDKSSQDVEAWQKEHIDAYGSFRDSLTQGEWLTSEVLTKTLEQFTMAAEEGSEEWEAFKKSLTSQGYTEKQAEEILKMANTATDAATKVKTFTQLLDTLKESAQSGWAQTWELIVGDFEEAKAFFTELSDLFGGMLGESADRRNGLLFEALGSNWDKLIKQINNAGIETEQFEGQIRKVVGDSKLDELVGEFGSVQKAAESGAISSEQLDKALDGIVNTSSDVAKGLEKVERNLWWGKTGEDVKAVQTALEKLGYSLGEKGIDGIIGKDTSDAIKAFQKANDLYVDGMIGPNTLKALKEAAAGIEDVTENVDDSIDSWKELTAAIDKTNGRTLLLESLMNVIHAIVRPIKAIGEAWRETFAISPDQLYNAIEKLHSFTEQFVPKGVLDATTWESLISGVEKFGISGIKFSSALDKVLQKNGTSLKKLREEHGSVAKAFEKGIVSKDHIKEALLGFSGITETLLESGEAADKVRRAFDGLFAILDIVKTIVTGPIKLGFKIFTGVLSNLGVDLLEFAASIGDAFVAFRDSIVNVIEDITGNIIADITEWIKSFKEMQIFKDISEKFKSASDTIKTALNDVVDAAKNFELSDLYAKLQSFGDFLVGIGQYISQTKAFSIVVGGVASAFEQLKSAFSKLDLRKLDIAGLKDFANNARKIEGKGVSGFSSLLSGFASVKFDGIKWNWDEMVAKSMGKFAEFWLNTGDKILDAFDVVKNFMIGVKEVVFGTEDVTLPVILNLVQKFLSIALLFSALKTIRGLISPFDGVTDAINNVAKSLKWRAIGDAFKSMALALGVLTVCIVILASMPDMNKTIAAAKMLGQLLVTMGLIIAGLTVVMKNTGNIDMLSTVGSLLMVVTALAILVGVISKLDTTNLIDPLGTFIELFAMLAVLSIGIKMVAKAGDANFGSIAAILVMITALDQILDVIKKYDEYPWEGMEDGIRHMADMLLLLAVVANVASRGVKAGAGVGGVALTLIAMLIGLRMVLNLITEFGAKAGTSEFEQGKNAVLGILAFMGALAFVIGRSVKPYAVEKGMRAVNSFSGLAFALIVVVGAIYVLGKMATDNRDILVNGGRAVGQILLIFTAMMAAVGKSGAGLKVGTIVAMLAGVVIVIGLLAYIIKDMQGVPWSSSLGIAGSIALVLLAMSMMFKILGSTNIDWKKALLWVGMLTVLAGIIAVLGWVLSNMKDVPATSALGGAAGLAILLGAMSSVFLILEKLNARKFSKSKLTKLLVMFAGLSAILFVLATVLGYMSGLGTSNAIENAVGLSALLFAIAGVFHVLSGLDMRHFSDQKIGKIIAMFAGMTIILGLLSVVLAIMSGLKATNAIPNAIALSVLLLAMSYALTILSDSKAMSWKKMGTILISMGVLALILVGISHVIKALDGISATKAIGNVIALSAMLLAMSGAMVILGHIKSVTFGAIAGMFALSVVVGILAQVLGNLAKNNYSLVIGNAISLGILLNTMASALLILGYVKSVSGPAIAGMFAMSIIVGMLAVPLGLLAKFQCDIAINNAISLGILLNAMALSLTILQGVQIVSGPALVGMLAMTVIVGLLAVILGALAKMQCDIALSTALSISALLIAMSAVFVVLGLTGGLAPTAVAGALGMMAVITIIGAIAIGIGGLMSLLPSSLIDQWKTGFENFMDFLVILATGIGQMAGGLISGVVSGFDGLGELGQNVRTFADSLSGISAIDIGAITSVAGAIAALTASSFVDAIGDLLFGDNDMASFGTEIAGFATGIKDAAGTLSDITESDAENIKRAAGAGTALAELNKSIPRSGGWLQDIIGSKELGPFTESCLAFANTMKEINAVISADDYNLDVAKVENLVVAGETFNRLNTALPRTGGVAQDLAGSKDLEGFAESCKAFAGVMKDIGTMLAEKDFTLDQNRVNKLVTAGETFNRLNTALPRTGGIAQDLAGTTDLEGFATSCVAFANAMIDIGSAVSGENGAIDTSKIDTLIAAGEIFNEFQGVLPESGGWWQNVVGETDIGDFGEKIKTFGEALVTYSSSIGGIDLAAITTSVTAATGIKTLIESLSGLDATGLSSFAGVGLGDGHLVNIGQAMATYGTEVAGLNIDAVNTSVSAAIRLRDLISNLAGLDASGIASFDVSTIGRLMQEYSVNVSGIDVAGVTASISAAGQLKDFISSLSGFDSSGVAAFETAVTNLGSISFDTLISNLQGKADAVASAAKSMVDALSSNLGDKTSGVENAAKSLAEVASTNIEAAVSVFGAAGEDSANAFAMGIMSTSGAAESAGSVLASRAKSGTDSRRGGAKQSGIYFGQGFVQGIEDLWDDAYQAAYTMGAEALRGLADKLAEASPSKEAKKSGRYFGEGFIIGIDSYNAAAYKSGYDIGESSLDGITSSISRISDAINSDIDSQPTIRPVLDLSDIESGAGNISRLLGDNSSIGIMTNAGAINSMMNRRAQNGGGSDVVAAIDKLRRDIATMPRETYSINGVTYDDGSNIRNFAQEVVRQAKVGRRV